MHRTGIILVFPLWLRSEKAGLFLFQYQHQFPKFYSFTYFILRIYLFISLLPLRLLHSINHPLYIYTPKITHSFASKKQFTHSFSTNTMSSGGKLQNSGIAKHVDHQTDFRIINDEGEVITKDFSLSFRLESEDDFPHPRHLCLTFPIGKSSPKRHCTKVHPIRTTNIYKLYIFLVYALLPFL